MRLVSIFSLTLVAWAASSPQSQAQSECSGSFFDVLFSCGPSKSPAPRREPVYRPAAAPKPHPRLARKEASTRQVPQHTSSAPSTPEKPRADSSGKPVAIRVIPVTPETVTDLKRKFVYVSSGDQYLSAADLDAMKPAFKKCKKDDVETCSVMAGQFPITIETIEGYKTCDEDELCRPIIFQAWCHAQEKKFVPVFEDSVIKFRCAPRE